MSNENMADSKDEVFSKSIAVFPMGDQRIGEAMNRGFIPFAIPAILMPSKVAGGVEVRMWVGLWGDMNVDDIDWARGPEKSVLDA